MRQPTSKIKQRTLNEHKIPSDPLKQFRQWYDVAVKAKLPLVDAMILATATRDGKPSARAVLLKDVGKRGFIFYTNFRSQIGRAHV